MTYPVEIHHKDGDHGLENGYNGFKKRVKGRGRLNRLVEWKRALRRGNLEIYCKEHHKEADARLLAAKESAGAA